ncbi:MAG: glycosyltransferase family 2 protein [Ignavibacteriales bacterium]|nr:glycosyltransferase family 2 protein [Ignavibacteriales bacterium]
MIDVSIVIINFNSFSLLDNCLQSLFAETRGVTFEVITVDNGSTEKGIDEIVKKYPTVKFIKNQKSVGFAAANNQGFTIAGGKYILMLNDDVIFIEDAITKVIDFSKTKNDKAIIGCKLLNEDKSYQISIVDFDSLPNLFGENLFLYKLFPVNKYLSKYHQNYTNQNFPVEVDAVKGAFLFMDREILKRLGGLDERFHFYYEETDFCYRWKNLGGKVYYYPGAEIVHIGGASTDSNLWFKYSNQHISKIQFFQKHFHGMKLILALILHELGLILRVPLYIVSGLLKADSTLIRKAVCYFRSIFLFPSKFSEIDK